MTREQQEMSLWAAEYSASRLLCAADRAAAADAAVAEFRKRYPAETAAPPVVWYDEPPCPKDGSVSPVWLWDYPLPVLAAYFGDGWWYEVPGRSDRWHPLAGRRVSPITEPPEPTQ